MPLYYDLTRATTTNATGNTETTHLWAKTVANQETVSIIGFYPHAYNFGTAGSCSIRAKVNTGTTASGGTAQTPVASNARYGVAAQSTWANDATAITAGLTLAVKWSTGLAQTGGPGGYVAVTPQAGIQMMPNAVNPVDVEFTSVAFTGAVPFELQVNFQEGI